MRKFIHRWLLTCCALLLSLASVPGQAESVSVADPGDNTVNQLVVNILQLALSKGPSGVTIRRVPEEKLPGKWEERLLQGNLDVEWGGAQRSNEEKFLPVRIPLFKGLLGYRILMIRKGEQHRFDGIRSLSQLKQFMAGQGYAWGDRLILEANGLPVTSGADSAELFSMLQRGVIDYFPRALHEPWGELEQYAENEPAVEQNLLLIYPYAMYFYVAPDNQQLHDQLYHGLEMAIEDGSFDDLFYNDPLIQTMLARASVGERTILRLINPYLDPATPFYRREFWLEPSLL